MNKKALIDGLSILILTLLAIGGSGLFLLSGDGGSYNVTNVTTFTNLTIGNLTNITNISYITLNVTNITNISIYNITNVTNTTIYNVTNVTNITNNNADTFYYYNVTNVTNITTSNYYNITNITNVSVNSSVSYKIPSSFQVVYGTVTDGNNLNNISYYDSHTLNISESAGVNAMLIYVNFSGVTSLDGVVMREYYAGGLGHEISLELYDGATGTWETYYEITDQTALTQSPIIPVIDGSNHINSTIVQIRFRHVSTGSASHRFRLDYINVVSGTILETAITHDSLEGRDSISTNHPDAYLYFQSLTSNLTYTNNTLNTALSNISRLEGSNATTNATVTNLISFVATLSGNATTTNLSATYIQSVLGSLITNHSSTNATAGNLVTFASSISANTTNLNVTLGNTQTVVGNLATNWSSTQSALNSLITNHSSTNATAGNLVTFASSISANTTNLNTTLGNLQTVTGGLASNVSSIQTNLYSTKFNASEFNNVTLLGLGVLTYAHNCTAGEVLQGINNQTMTCVTPTATVTATQVRGLGFNTTVTCEAGKYLNGFTNTTATCTTENLGTVTSVANGSGLNGGTITSTGTLSINPLSGLMRLYNSSYYSVRAYAGGVSYYNNAWRSTNFSAEAFDNASQHSTASDDRIIFARNGIVALNCNLFVANNTVMGARIVINGAYTVVEQRAGNSGVGERHAVGGIWNVVTGDYAQCQGWTTATQGNSGNSSNSFSAFYLAG